ncbi:hypothetical protein ACFVZJ_18630 [Streptomyces sp. NPDC058322]|uniref:hypothetical protein n=1 Tax=Streptomyces sp. NPDC058322 TaxID=3346446 RepID=UPI0036E4CF71
MGMLIAGAHIRYPMPGACHHPMAGTFAPPDLVLHTDKDVTGVAQLLRLARPGLFDLADRPGLREVARG